MALERDSAAPQAAAAPPVAAPGVPVSDNAVLALQRTAGNQAVCRAIASGMLARDDAAPAADKPITGLSVTPIKASMPLDAGTTITAAAKPAGVGGVKYSLGAGTVAPAAGTTIDATSGVVALDAKQPGGQLKAKAENAAAEADQPFRVVEKPKDIASTTSSAAGQYEAHFTHTFNSAGASSAGLEDMNINEKFDSLTAKTPFGSDFTLQANKAGSKGWFLDSSGAMTGVDKVSIGKAGIDATPFVKNASNPSPAASLPQGFNMTQKLHAKSYPADTLDDAPFTTTEHVRKLVEKDGKLKVLIGAGKGSEHIDYAGPAVFRGAKADKTTVEASEPKPTSGKWAQNEVQVSVEAEPAGAAVTYSIPGEKLGCSVDAAGKVLIGSTAGKITVRAGDAKHYDEVVITITAPAPAPGGAAPPKPAGVEPELEPPVE